MEKPYTELVAQAERAVAAVKDAELRRVAFEKILDDLLVTSAGSGSKQDGMRATAGKPVPTKGTRNKKQAAVAEKRSKRAGPSAYVEEMISEDFFSKPKTIAEVKAELQNRGHHIPLTSLSGPLQKLCQNKLLRRQKVSAEGQKKGFAYSNW